MDLEPYVHMQVYSFSKRGIVLFFLGFLISVAVSIALGSAGPKMLTVRQLNATASQTLARRGLWSQEIFRRDIVSGTGQEFIFNISGTNKLNQQIWLSSTLYKRDPSRAISPVANISVIVQGFNTYTQEFVNVTNVKALSKAEYTCPSSSKPCDNVTILNIPFLDYELYNIRLSMDGLQYDSNAIESHVFSLIAFNDVFTLYELYYRFGFLMLSMVTVSVFTWRLRRNEFSAWSLEQKWLLFLLFLLIGFNNPFYSLTLLLDGIGPIILDSVLQSSFVSGLLLYWLCVFHGIRVTSRPFLRFYLPKIALVSIIWFLMMAMSTLQSSEYLLETAFLEDVSVAPMRGLQIAFLLFCSGYAFLLLYLVFRGVGDAAVKPYLDIRLKFLGALTLIVVIFAVAGTLASNSWLRFGNAVTFLVYYSIFNVYIYAMAIAYSPVLEKREGGIRLLDEDFQTSDGITPAGQAYLPEDDYQSNWEQQDFVRS